MAWQQLRHNGVAFPPPYTYRGFTIRIKGEPLLLNPQQEEMIYAWCKKRKTSLFNDPVAQRNFLSDFVKLLPQRFRDIEMKDLDLSEVITYQEREENHQPSKEERKLLAALRRSSRERLKAIFGYAEVDGRRIEVANYVVEPPCIFVGRGEHPLRGRWKRRIFPEDVVLNLDEGAPVPPGNWKKVVHEHDNIWIASWYDELSKKWKYVWPADSSSLRQSRDKRKYDLAMKLEGRLDRVRAAIAKGMRSKDEKTRKIATVCYLIDKLVMRVGDEKDEDEVDTVGASTLRVEHVKIVEEGDGEGGRRIEFDFLGKDAVPWHKSLSLEEVDPQFVENLRYFMKGKGKEEPIFDGIRSEDVNRFLGRCMKGLTAKVFRTYHATKVVMEYLFRNGLNGSSREEKLFHAKMANLEAAIACNHKRTPPKNWEEALRRKEERLRQLREELRRRLREAKESKVKGKVKGKGKGKGRGKRGRRVLTEKARARLEERIRKLELAIELAKRTKEYNLNTSLKNYIDPRVYKGWAERVGLDWRSIYTKSLLKKLGWAARSKGIIPYSQ